MKQPPRSSGDSPTICASLSVSSGATSFADANSWFERVLDDAKLPDDAHADLLVVFEEVVVNVVTHAYGVARGTIDISVERNADALTLAVRDDGPPFDPTAQPAPDFELPASRRPLGGLGVHLVKSLCDRVEYQRRGESNILVLTKKLR